MKWRSGFSILALLLITSGCIPTQRELAMERDLEEMKRRLAETERALATQKLGRNDEVKDRLDALARSQADLQAALDMMRVDLQSANGRFEDLGRDRAGLREELSLTRDDLGLKITALEDRISKLEEKVRTQGGAPAAPAAPAESLYDQGVDLIQKREEFSRGRELLQEFLTRNPKSPLAVNAMYWIGEAYYGEKKYENAILQFQDVVQKFGDHPKVAAALLKQGITFHTLGDLKNARVILQRVVDTFPLSEEAKKAKARLAEWGGKKS